jgi:SAM-dependent methyltransferase
MPRPPQGGGDLLDIGCGDGTFLRTARSCGWNAIGVEPDARSAAIARARGFTVHLGDIEVFLGQKEKFDVITLNHVIEHVHEPTELLQICYELLRSGGMIWLETPNVCSLGHRLFGCNWRGLEMPRHLVLFNCGSIQSALKEANFVRIKVAPYKNVCFGMFSQSYDISTGLLPSPGARSYSFMLKVFAGLSGLVEKVNPRVREFLTVSAVKGSS